MKKILIVSYFFYKENTPRSFRAFELARELSKYYDVKVLTTDKDIESDFFKKYDLDVKYIKSGFFLNKKVESFERIRNTQKSDNILKNFVKFLKKIYNYLFFGREIEFFYFVYKYLKDEKVKYNAIISIALPFSSHLGTYLGLKKNKNLTEKLILEYGDPFFYNKSFKMAYYFKIVEYIILKKAKYIVLPIEKAREAFKKYKIDKKIKIIPQGFRLDEYELEKYKKNEIPTFIYAGVFYEKIRNPINILKSLNSIEKQFKFIIYSNEDSIQKMNIGKEILNEIQKSDGKIVLKSFITRNNCIKEMSKADFLLNISNLNQDQSPSKLIDYSIAKRPILTVNQNSFNIDIFFEFLNGDYSKQTIIELEKYDIETIGKNYRILIEN